MKHNFNKELSFFSKQWLFRTIIISICPPRPPIAKQQWKRKRSTLAVYLQFSSNGRRVRGSVVVIA